VAQRLGESYLASFSSSELSLAVDLFPLGSICQDATVQIDGWKLQHPEQSEDARAISVLGMQVFLSRCLPLVGQQDASVMLPWAHRPIGAASPADGLKINEPYLVVLFKK
jgi:hypothetical protein